MNRRTFTLSLASILTACGGGGDEPVRVSLYGDSVTFGAYERDGQIKRLTVPTSKRIETYGFSVTDYSEAGNTSARAESLSRFDDGSSVAVIRLGMADAVYKVPTFETRASIEKLVNKAKAAGKKVLLVGLTRINHAETEQAATACDAMLRDFATSMGVLFVDVRQIPFTPSMLADSIHPGQDYSNACADLIASKL